MRVGLVTATHFAVVRLVAGVDVGMLFPVTAIREFSVAAVKLTFERLLTCKKKIIIIIYASYMLLHK